MSQQHPVILYIGHPEQGQSLQTAVQSQGWYVSIATETLEALGQYVFYQPDIVVINGEPCADLARETHFHLASIEAEPVLILTHQAGDWQAAAQDGAHLLPQDTGINQLMSTIADLVRSESYEPAL